MKEDIVKVSTLHVGSPHYFFFMSFVCVSLQTPVLLPSVRVVLPPVLDLVHPLACLEVRRAQLLIINVSMSMKSLKWNVIVF